MREVLELPADTITPSPADMLRAQGAPPGARPRGRTLELCEQARGIFAELARPLGVYQSISAADFAEVYRGTGENAEQSPLSEVHPRARNLALFAVTLGAKLTRRIDSLFAKRDFALAALLDSAASEGAELAADALEAHYDERLERAGIPSRERAILRYSPGYCGWHVSGQRALFAALAPEKIGLTLRESCLMEPLKSISGVLVAGAAEIHHFADDYEFCAECTEHACRERIANASTPRARKGAGHG